MMVILQKKFHRHTAPAMISTFRYLHNILMISLTSVLNFPYNTFFLYFGINTM